MDDQQAMTALVTPLGGPPPAIHWQWEPETDILTGAYRRVRAGESSASLELVSPEGAVIVLDLIEGEVCGLDVVIWPDVETRAGLQAPPPLSMGRVSLPMAREPREVDQELAIEVDGLEETFHLVVGPRRLATAVRVADHLLVEVDSANRLAGFWLTGVPPFPSEE